MPPSRRHILFTAGHAGKQSALAFSSRSGVLTAVRRDDGITLDFPATPLATVESVPGLFAALGGAPDAARFVGRIRFDAFVELPSEAAVRAVQPEFVALGKLPVRAIIVTAAAQAETDAHFVSRFFAPSVGVPEDHVTGSAHCALAPYWCARLQRDSLRGLQVSRRSGVVQVRCSGDRVQLRGRCITMLRGQLGA